MDRVDRQRLIGGWRQGLVDSAQIDVVVNSGTPPLIVEAFLPAAILLGIGRLRLLGHPQTAVILNRMQNYADSIRSRSELLSADEPTAEPSQAEGLCFSVNFCNGPPSPLSPPGDGPSRTVWGRLSGNRAIWGDEAPAAAFHAMRSERDASHPGADSAGLSLILAGACLAEIVRRVVPLPAWADSDLCGPVCFPEDPPAALNACSQTINTMAVVGAGAIGNWFLFGLLHDPTAHERLQMILVDDDAVQWSNLNRQVLFTAEDVGRSKVEALQEKLILAGRPQTTALRCRLVENNFFRSRGLTPDLLVSCLDNRRARKLLNDIALSEHIPLLNGGSDPFSANAHLYLPHRSPCLDCMLNLTRHAETEVAPQSCAAADPSVVFTNMIAAGMMLWQMHHPPDFAQGLLAYDLTLSQRIGRMERFDRDDNCVCTKRVGMTAEQ